MAQKAAGFWAAPLEYPQSNLLLYFVLWKTLLFLIAIVSPGPGYDTSTTLLNSTSNGLSHKFVRWDAIYFTEIARRGYVFEQEWAFGWGYTRALAILAKCNISPVLAIRSFADHLDLDLFTDMSPIDIEARAGVFLSHLSHFLSILALYHLSKSIFRQSVKADKIALIAASLHVITPAGLFLSAPCTESLFSCLHFSGLYLYSLSLWERSHGSSWKRDAFLILSGCLVGLATTVRSNGVLTGLLFAYDTVIEMRWLSQNSANVTQLRALTVTILGGALVATGASVPQYIGYKEYCSGDDNGLPRKWCISLVPSIYSFVQRHYWLASSLTGKFTIAD